MSMNVTTTESLEEDYTNRSWTVPYLCILLIFGTIGNVSGFVLFLTATMRQYSCTLYFFLLTIFDEISLFSWITNRLSRELTSIQLRDRSTVLCKLFVVIFYNASQASTGMLVLAMIDRLYTSFKIARGHFAVGLMISRDRFQYTCLTCFFLILFGFNAILFGSQLVVMDEEIDNYCIIIDLQVNQVYSIIDLILYALLPCLCMFFGNILILYYLQQSRARVHSSNTRSSRREQQLSFMFVIITIISLFIVSPYSFLNLLINFSSILNDDYRTLHTLNDIFGLLSTLTHAMHFYLFLIISGTIRKQFCNIIGRYFPFRFCRSNAIRPMMVSTIETNTITQPLHQTRLRESNPRFQTKYQRNFIGQ